MCLLSPVHICRAPDTHFQMMHALSQHLLLSLTPLFVYLSTGVPLLLSGPGFCHPATMLPEGRIGKDPAP